MSDINILKHSTAHLLAHAVRELYDGVYNTIGPATSDGFYQDFANAPAFTPNDLATIEAKMHEIANRNYSIVQETWSREYAIDFFNKNSEYYKIDIIKNIPQNESISIYKQGNFTDLCKGPHVAYTGQIKYFKLINVSAVHWYLDNTQPMLQRIYGTVYDTQYALDNHFEILNELAKRDHRKIGNDLDLFHFQNEAPGMVFWHRNGCLLFNIIEQYIRTMLLKFQYIEVKTPLLLSNNIWKISGHWSYFKDNMFVLSDNDTGYSIKPMNCPGHIQIYKKNLVSYKDLPLRMFEFGICHRKEASGALHGLMRVQSLTIDDGHIFCTYEQIKDETIQFITLLTQIYKDFGFSNIYIKLSNRPSQRSGSDEIWDKAEHALHDALQILQIKYDINHGDGAFYGPKLEFILRDAIGREWQCGTLQLDFILPEKFEMEYINSDNIAQRPVILHRAILGSLERFIGILIEHYAGLFPLWLSPIQVGIATVTHNVIEYAYNVNKILLDSNIRTKIDTSNNRINRKIRDFIAYKTPITIVIGTQEMDTNTVSVRYYGSNENFVIHLPDILNIFK